MSCLSPWGNLLPMGGSILQQMLLLCLTHPSSSKAAVIPAPCHLFIIVHFDLQFRQSHTLVAGSCSGCSCRRCSLEMGTLQALESAAGEQAGSAVASDHAQVPRFRSRSFSPGMPHALQACGVLASLLWVGRFPIPYLILPPLSSLLLLNNF